MGIIEDFVFRFFGGLWRLLKAPLKLFVFKLGGYWLIIAGLIGYMIDPEGETPIIGLFILLGWFIVFYYIVRLFKRKKEPKWGIISILLKKSSAKNEAKILDPDVPEKLLDMENNEKRGVFFGVKDGKNVCQPENLDGHVLILGGPGSGKSTSVLIPTVRHWGAKKTGSWQHTMFVIDIKPELADKGLTDEQMKRTKIFNPTLEWDTCGFDCFYLAKMRTRPDEVLQDISDIAWAIIPESTSRDPYWENSARDVLIGVLLYGFRIKNFGFIDTLEWLADHSSREVITEISECADPDCRRQVKEFVESPDNTLGSIWGSLMRPIKVFYQDGMIKNALRKDGDEGMSPQDLENGWNIFCQIPEPKLEQWRSVLTLMINQFLKFFEMRDEQTRKLGDESILFMIDEAPRMGKLRLKEGLATLRSKGIHIVLAAQSISQFKGIYGDHDSTSILSNVGYLACLSATDTESQRWLSAKCGKFDKQMKSTSINQRDLDPFGGSGVSYSEQLRDIIPPEFFGELPNHNLMILFNPHSRFCRINKDPWYKNEEWVKEVEERMKKNG